MGLSALGGLTPAAFLRDYWQQKPLAVRGAFPGLMPPMSPADLMALACRDDVFARLILEAAGSSPWELIPGPFERDELQDLPQEGWTLLVGGVERHVPAAAALLAPFRFLPNWRFDDVQASYAPPGGSAGPHFDHYDVFLVQGYGRRRWRISHAPAPEDTAFMPDADLAILADFAPDAEWVLEPGDLLYLPPRRPHWGVAVDHCMTYSVGFRAPTVQDVLAGLLDAATSNADAAHRYGDARRPPSAHPGRIDPADVDRVRAVVRRFLDMDMERWFGAFITASGLDFAEPAVPLTAIEIGDLISSGAALSRVSVGSLVHVECRDCVCLYAGGQEYILGPDQLEVARLITGTKPLTHNTLKPYLRMAAVAQALADMVNSGCLALDARR